jgi:adenine C2-methylase RlmN of 23S rRNA A2503 and tRNA A37
MPARLAWSVHAANDSTRKLLVPTTAHTVTELKDAFKGMVAQYILQYQVLLDVCNGVCRCIGIVHVCSVVKITLTVS